MWKISNQEAEDFMILRTELAGGVSPFPWSLPQSALKLSSHDVHIWLTKLNSLTKHVQQMAQYLNEDERMRAKRFHFTRDIERFIVGRGVLKIILGRYLHIEPNRVWFS